MDKRRHDSPTRRGEAGEQHVAQGTVDARLVRVLRDATVAGHDPVAPAPGHRCPACDSVNVVVCGVYRRDVDGGEAREFQVVLACRACEEYARFEPPVTYRAERPRP